MGFLSDNIGSDLGVAGALLMASDDYTALENRGAGKAVTRKEEWMEATGTLGQSQFTTMQSNDPWVRVTGNEFRLKRKNFESNGGRWNGCPHEAAGSSTLDVLTHLAVHLTEGITPPPSLVPARTAYELANQRSQKIVSYDVQKMDNDKKY
ncbi:hypothetical protein AAY473_015649 [Plecturocebus cupreus]